ncbi:MAG TPA: HdeD family acid-resistance protein [Dehalococcoidia bacterium]|jgi:uncharacterized membrane protein HdeD (DUF308 family)
MSATANPMEILSEKHWWQVAVRGLIALIFGILVLAWPGVAIAILAIIFGAFVFVDGIFTLIAAVNYKAGAGRRTWLFIRGIAGIIVGLITFFWPAITALALVILIAAWALVTGVMELIYAFRANQDSAIRWMFAISGILSLILGALMLAQPLLGALVIVWIIGAYAVLAGILLIILGFRLRSVKAS